MKVLGISNEMNGKILTRSSIILVVCERDEEVSETVRDLRAVACDVVALGQYSLCHPRAYSRS